MVITVLVCIVATLLVLGLIGLPFVVWSLLGLAMRNVGLHLNSDFLRHGLNPHALPFELRRAEGAPTAGVGRGCVKTRRGRRRSESRPLRWIQVALFRCAKGSRAPENMTQGSFHTASAITGQFAHGSQQCFPPPAKRPLGCCDAGPAKNSCIAWGR